MSHKESSKSMFPSSSSLDCCGASKRISGESERDSGNSAKKSKIEENIVGDSNDKVEEQKKSGGEQFIKKARPTPMASESDSNNNNAVKQLATNITYQKSNVSRAQRLNVSFLERRHFFFYS